MYDNNKYNQEFGERIRTARKNLKMTMKELGEKVELHESTVQRYENGAIKTLDIDKAKDFARALNISMPYLMGWADDNNSDYEISNIIPLKTKRVPLVGEIVAGKPKYADEHFEFYIEIDDVIKADFCLKVKGDSMINARIYDGDIVFIKEQPDVEDGEIAAVRIDDEATLKRVYKMPGRIQLRAENPEYEPINISEDDHKDIEILGKAIAFQSKVR